MILPPRAILLNALCLCSPLFLIIGLLFVFPACRRIESIEHVSLPAEVVTPTPLPEPLGPTLRVRVLERLSPTKLIVRGPVRVRPEGGQARDLQKATFRFQRREVLLDGVAIGEGAFVIPLDHELWIDPGGGYDRRLSGRLEVWAGRKALVVFVDIPIEDYVAGVLEAEVPGGTAGALKAHAILTRTYALAHRARHGSYDACDLTHCQVFRGLSGEAYQKAARATAGQVLSADGKSVAEVAYASTCGGHTASLKTIWPRDRGFLSLIGVRDTRPDGTPWCANSPHATWRFEVEEDTLAKVLEEEVGQAPTRPLSLSLERGEGGWVSWVRVAGLETDLTGEEWHLMLGRRFGWGKFKSANFDAHLKTLTDGDAAGKPGVLFEGQGLGHGVGLCQTGAMAMGKAGYSQEAILRHYFPKLRLIESPLEPSLPPSSAAGLE